ncbi:Protein of unknown function, partial [Gryllus bimaculatus]
LIFAYNCAPYNEANALRSWLCARERRQPRRAAPRTTRRGSTSAAISWPAAANSAPRRAKLRRPGPRCAASPPNKSPARFTCPPRRYARFIAYKAFSDSRSRDDRADPTRPAMPRRCPPRHTNKFSAPLRPLVQEPFKPLRLSTLILVAVTCHRKRTGYGRELREIDTRYEGDGTRLPGKRKGGGEGGVPRRQRRQLSKEKQQFYALFYTSVNELIGVGRGRQHLGRGGAGPGRAGAAGAEQRRGARQSLGDVPPTPAASPADGPAPARPCAATQPAGPRGDSRQLHCPALGFAVGSFLILLPHKQRRNMGVLENDIS